LSAARRRVLTAARMREADLARIAAGTPVTTLMERAARGALVAIERAWGRRHGFRHAIVTGKGNNAGDGFVLARLLAGRGARVTVHPVADPASLSGPPREAFDALAPTAVRVAAAGSDGPAIAPETDVVVDALLGTGSAGALAPPYAAAVRAIAAARARGARVVALDLPSGFDADTGRPLDGDGPAVEADLTVTFAHPKPVHVLYPGRAACGTLAVVDIGVEPATPGDDPELLDEAGVAALLPRRGPTAHKGSAGRVLFVGGSVGLTGAVVLGSMAALRAGAGYVVAAVPESVNDAIESAMIEPMTWPLPESPERALAMGAVPFVLTRAREAQVVALGPGLSRTPEALEVARAIVAASPVPVVLDADGLVAFAGGQGAALARRAAGVGLVVTPHVGEMSRLTGLAAVAIERGRLTLPARLAREWNAVVVLKGAPTVIAAPDGRVAVNPTGNPGMATMGMGDVLTGVIAGFVAQGLSPFDAACAAVFVHGLAADVAHASVGTLSLVAGDVTATLPQVLSRLANLGPDGTRSSARALPPDRIAPDPPE
jgi:hydroxyethylthiazole kinase-like uncharacterized protein yjeF